MNDKIAKEFGRTLSQPNRGTIPGFARSDLGKPLQTSIRIFEIRTEHLLNTNLDCYL